MTLLRKQFQALDHVGTPVSINGSPYDVCTDDHFIIKYIGSASRSAKYERRMTGGCDRGVRTEEQSGLEPVTQ
jgi:hypothetical protein